MRNAPPKTDRVPPVGSLVKMRFGADNVVATVIEDRGPLGVGGRHLVRVRFHLEAVEEPVETEVPAEELSLVALANDPADRRVGVEAVADMWVGTYTAPDGRVAVVTAEMRTAEQARRAALRWVKVGVAERGSRRGREEAYEWRLDPRYPGRYCVFRRGRLGDELVREPAN